MTLNENMPRLVTKSPLISIASLFYSSGWFVASVVVLCYFLITKRRQQPPPLRAVPNTLLILAPNSLVSSEDAQQPQSILVPRDTNYRVTFGDLPRVLQRRGRRDAPAMIAVVPPESGSITISSSPESPSIMVSTSSAPVSAPPAVKEELIAQEAPAEVEEPTQDEEEDVTPEPEPEQESSAAPSICSVVRKPTLQMKFPKVFRRKSRRGSGSSQDNSRPSTPRDFTPPQSPQQRLAELLPENGRETIPLTQRKSYHRPEDDSEFIRTRFVNPLRFKPKRTLSNSDSGNNIAGQSTASSPTSRPSSPPSAFTHHKRNRSLASIVGMAVRPRSRRTKSTSPHRGSFSSVSTTSSSTYTSSSASSSSSSAMKRAFPFPCTPIAPETRDVPRTQPYGAPYYAPLPVPASRPHMRRASVTHTGGVVSERESEERERAEYAREKRTRRESLKSTTSKSKFVEHMDEPEDIEVHTTAVDDEEGSLGLDLGGDVRRSTSTRRRGRAVRGGSGAVR